MNTPRYEWGGRMSPQAFTELMCDVAVAARPFGGDMTPDCFTAMQAAVKPRPGEGSGVYMDYGLAPGGGWLPVVRIGQKVADIAAASERYATVARTTPRKQLELLGCTAVKGLSGAEVKITYNFWRSGNRRAPVHEASLAFRRDIQPGWGIVQVVRAIHRRRSVSRGPEMHRYTRLVGNWPADLPQPLPRGWRIFLQAYFNNPTFPVSAHLSPDDIYELTQRPLTEADALQVSR